MPKILGERYDVFLEHIQTDFRRELDEFKTQKQETYRFADSEAGKRELTEEYLATLAEQFSDGKLTDRSTLDRVIDAIRAFLRRIPAFRNMAFTRGEIEDLLRASARAMRRGKAGNAGGEVKFAAALRREGAPNRAGETGQLRDGNVPCADGFMEWAKLSGSRLYADYEFLYGRHPQYFQSPEEVRAAVELVLAMPEKVQDIGNNMSFAGSDEETGKIYRIEINPQPKRKENHIRSVFEITPEQYEKIKLEESPVLQPSPTEDINHAAARTISSFLRNNITDSDEKSSGNSTKK